MTAAMDIAPLPVTVSDPGFVPSEAVFGVPLIIAAASATTSYVEAFAVGTAGAGACILTADNTDTSAYLYISTEGATPTHWLIVPPGGSKTLDLGMNGREISSQIMYKRFGGSPGSGSYILQIVK